MLILSNVECDARSSHVMTVFSTIIVRRKKNRFARSDIYLLRKNSMYRKRSNFFLHVDEKYSRNTSILFSLDLISLRFRLCLSSCILNVKNSHFFEFKVSLTQTNLKK